MILEAQQIQQIDVPNKNNRVYPLSVIQRIIEDNNNKPVSGTVGMPKVVREQGYPFDLTVKEKDIGHYATDLRIEDGWLVADIQIFNNNPQGQILKELLKHVQLDFRIAGYCRTRESTIATDIMEVYDFRLCSINAVEDGA